MSCPSFQISNHASKTVSVNICVASCRGHAPMAEQLSKFTKVSALFVEMQVCGTTAKSVGRDDRYPSRPTRCCQTPIEGLIADGSPIALWEQQLTSCELNRSLSQPLRLSPEETGRFDVAALHPYGAANGSLCPLRSIPSFPGDPVTALPCSLTPGGPPRRVRSGLFKLTSLRSTS